MRKDTRTYDPHRRWGCLGVLALWALYLAGIIWASTVLCSCSTTRYVPVESVRTEWRDRDVERLVTDTIRDTRFVLVKGDTVVDIRKKERVRLVEIHDTLQVVLTDTIREPYPVERKLTRWEKVKMDFGGMALGCTALGVCALLAWLMIKMRRR